MKPYKRWYVYTNNGVLKAHGEHYSKITDKKLKDEIARAFGYTDEEYTIKIYK